MSHLCRARLFIAGLQHYTTLKDGFLFLHRLKSGAVASSKENRQPDYNHYNWLEQNPLIGR